MSEFLNTHHLPVAITAALACNGWVLYVTFVAYMRNLQAQIAAANARLKAEVLFDELTKTEDEDGVSQSDNRKDTQPR